MAATVSKTNQKNFFGVKPKDYIYEDDQCIVFDEFNNPQAPVHYVVVPKTRIPRLSDASVEDEKILGHLLATSRRVAQRRGLSDGFRVVMEEAPASDPHPRGFHVQVLAGRQMTWPFGHLLLVAKELAISKGIQRSGYHVMVDEDHRAPRLKALHVFGRALQHMLWPVGPGSRL